MIHLEAEFLAVGTAVQEGALVQHVLAELGVTAKTPRTLRQLVRTSAGEQARSRTAEAYADTRIVCTGGSSSRKA